MTKRSFTKEKDLPTKKNFAYTCNYGKEFSESNKSGKNEDFSNLSEIGRSIITRFVKENEIRENKLKEKEEEYFEYKHSKAQVNYNPWKCSNHIIEEFSRPPGDKVVSYKKEPKKKFLIDKPFLRPKRDGDYFEKGVKII